MTEYQLTHPLTDEICDDLGDIREISEIPAIPAMLRPGRQLRAAYDKGRDDQLKQVINWLHGNLDEYSTDTDPGFFWPMSKLLPDLEKAMRPTQEDN